MGSPSIRCSGVEVVVLVVLAAAAAIWKLFYEG
jgi:hypothetical protein